MQLDERMVGDIAIVKITGEITLKKSRDAALRDKVMGLVGRGLKKVLVDLADVSYVDSAGLGELVQANSTTKDQGGSLKFFGPPARLREMLTLTKLTTVLSIHDDEAQALASFGTTSS